MSPLADLVVYLILIVTRLPSLTLGHGRMVAPASRMSAYLFDFPTPPNYEDNEMNCGGLSTQWDQNDGRCTICGESWSGPHDYERPDGRNVQHDVITATYKENESIQVQIQLTQNHKGWFEFRLCDVSTSGGVEADQACLDRNLLAEDTGRTRFDSPSEQSGFFDFNLVLPSGLTCEHCVLQWKWKCGNNWGCDAPGDCGLGKGERQEEFYACSDVKIESRSGSSRVDPSPSRLNPNQRDPNHRRPSDNRPNPNVRRPNDNQSDRNPNRPSYRRPNPNPPSRPNPRPVSNPRPIADPIRNPSPPRPAPPVNPGQGGGEQAEIPGGFSSYIEYLEDVFSTRTNEALKYTNKVQYKPAARRNRNRERNSRRFDQQFLRDVIGYPATSRQSVPSYDRSAGMMGGYPSWLAPDPQEAQDAVDRLCAACHVHCRFDECRWQCGEDCRAY